MNTSIYTARFGEFPVRFVVKNGDVFVSRDDLIAALNDCFVPNLRQFVVKFFDDGLRILGDAGDRRVVLLGESDIGPAIHFHAIGNLMNSLCNLAWKPYEDGEQASNDLRESCFRVNSLMKWYLATLSQVDDYFGRTITDMMYSVKTRLDRINPAFIVNVTHDTESGMWVAVCDEIGLVTESETYEGLTERVWEIAPEIAVENGIDVSADTMRISFHQDQTTRDRISVVIHGQQPLSAVAEHFA